MEPLRFVRLIRRALDGGARRLSLTTFTWDTAPKCEHPVLRTVQSRPLGDDAIARLVACGKGLARRDWSRGQDHVLFLDMWCACRVCGPCLDQRRRLWTSRAAAECSAAPRTWFVTFTVSPETWFRWESELRQREAQQNMTFERLPPAVQWTARVNRLGRELTLWLKRLRKAGASIRYLAVTEPHKSGLPHLHLLVHETGEPVRKALMRQHWTAGFSQFKLVDDNQRAARYVCKYLLKSSRTRVRGSVLYGSCGALPEA